MIARWRAWQEARALRRHAIPDGLWLLTLARYPFLSTLDDAEQAELRRLCALFLSAKEFHGAGGFVVSDEVAVAIAAQACLPILRLGLEAYAGFVGIVVHAGEVLARREFMDEDGVVHRYEEVLAGEAMEGGPLMLAWSESSPDAQAGELPYNVVIHEFAHVLDMQNGAADGVPALAAGEREAWLDVLESEWQAFCDAVDAGVETLIDPYGAEAIEEFFAVAVEAFFVAPLALSLEQPALYQLLRGYFHQDPAARLARC
ncbi:zinc-dependent peptidase [Roseateles aquae]|uniref:M90 family metallopeptidase n=1 Tax=Roseateles aquae TaxID=3077235 RepID=UPI003D9C7AD6